MRLKVTVKKLHDLHPADVAEIISDFNRRRVAIYRSAGPRASGRCTGRGRTRFPGQPGSEMSDEKVADVLEEMAPDEAADLLAELPKERSEDLLELMEKEDADDVRTAGLSGGISRWSHDH